jgi:hypothetical protein
MVIPTLRNWVIGLALAAVLAAAAWQVVPSLAPAWTVRNVPWPGPLMRAITTRATVAVDPGQSALLVEARLQARSMGARAVPHLLHCLRTGDTATRQAAVWLLPATGQTEAMDATIVAFSDPDPWVRAKAARSYARERPEGWCMKLMPMLADPDERIVRAAVAELLQSASPEEFRECVRHCIAKEGDPVILEGIKRVVDGWKPGIAPPIGE